MSKEPSVIRALKNSNLEAEKPLSRKLVKTVKLDVPDFTSGIKYPLILKRLSKK